MVRNIEGMQEVVKNIACDKLAESKHLYVLLTR